MNRILAFFGLCLSLLVFAHPAVANDLTGAQATVDCNGYSLSMDAKLLTVGNPYTINFTFTLTPTSGPAISVPGTITFTANAVMEAGRTVGGFLHRDRVGNAHQFRLDSSNHSERFERSSIDLRPRWPHDRRWQCVRD
jgi:hypothetical protein